MTNYQIDSSVIIITTSDQLSHSGHIWGTGGWSPDGILAYYEREALDWLTLLKLSGFQVKVLLINDLEDNLDCLENASCLIMACDQSIINKQTQKILSSILESKEVLLIIRIDNIETDRLPLWGIEKKNKKIEGYKLKWTGPGKKREWSCRTAQKFYPIENGKNQIVWATLNGEPIITAISFKKGMIAALSFHPSEKRELEGVMTALLKHLLINHSSKCIKHVDLSGVMILRMDDPGSAQNVYLKEWSHQKLSQKIWKKIGEDLKYRKGKMSIAYVSGVVDDGNAKRGNLTIDGATIERIPGKIYSSPLVKYEDLNGHLPGSVYDFGNEYKGIRELQEQDLVSIELHGYTHMNPDVLSWSNADDRYDSVDWFREFGPAGQNVISKLPVKEHPLYLGKKSLQKFFGINPSALICPGDHWTEEVFEHALKLKVQLMSSYYLAIRHEDKFCWAYHVCSPYLDEPAPEWFDSEMPVIGYLHDRDIAIYGVDWFISNLNKWQNAGAKEFINFKELCNRLDL